MARPGSVGCQRELQVRNDKVRIVARRVGINGWREPTALIGIVERQQFFTRPVAFGRTGIAVDQTARRSRTVNHNIAFVSRIIGYAHLGSVAIGDRRRRFGISRHPVGAVPIGPVGRCCNITVAFDTRDVLSWAWNGLRPNRTCKDTCRSNRMPPAQNARLRSNGRGSHGCQLLPPSADDNNPEKFAVHASLSSGSSDLNE